MSLVIRPGAAARPHSTFGDTEKPLRWTLWQAKWAAIQVAAILGLFAGRLLLTWDHTALLLTTAAGARMVAQASIVLAVILGASFGWCVLLDLVFPTLPERRPRVAKFLTGALCVVQIVLFLLPAFSVILVGPATIQISENLLAG
jgi:hypothetical protein